jgi:hypothetical protein
MESPADFVSGAFHFIEGTSDISYSRHLKLSGVSKPALHARARTQLDQTLRDWIGGGEQVDDILVMGIRC